jgi:hypothetical protein
MKKIILTIIVLTLNGCSAMQSIDKGLYKVTDSVTQVDKITGKRNLSSTRQKQIANGNKIIDDMLIAADEKGLLYNEKLDAEAYDRVNKIFERIHLVSHLRDEKWKVILIPDASFNAFVTGGTYIIVHSGLEKQLTDDSELAAVIGHEFAHVTANHIGETDYSQKFTLLSGSKSSKRSSFKAAFTHENEEEADKIGILYAALAGYDPYAAHRVWLDKYESNGDRKDMYVDHPIYSERASLTKKTAQDVAEYYSEDVVNQDYENILKRNNLFSYKEGSYKNMAGKGGGFLALLDTSLQQVLKHKKAKNEEARQGNRIHLLNAVNNLLKVVKVDQIGQNQWQFTVEYIGNKKIYGLQFVGALYQDKKLISRLKAKPSGALSPRGRYHILAYSDKNLALGTRVSGYVFKVSDVKVYR